LCVEVAFFLLGMVQFIDSSTVAHILSSYDGSIQVRDLWSSGLLYPTKQYRTKVTNFFSKMTKILSDKKPDKIFVTLTNF